MNMTLDRVESPDAKKLEVIIAEAIAKTWLEPEFARKLLQFPTEALVELGASWDSNVDIQVTRGYETKLSQSQSGGRTVYDLTLSPCPVELNQGNMDEDWEQLSKAKAFENSPLHYFWPTTCCG